MTPRRVGRRWVRVLLVLLLLLLGGGWGFYEWTFPYGWSHCCDKQLRLALESYAADHGGAYPAGEATPEASLSLLYPKYADANLLRGKTVPMDVVQAKLDRGERLDPETCGWHYVEGLRSGDDGRLALFWDKAGLGHNGQRNWGGGRYVALVGFNWRHVPGAEWAAFVAEQDQLLAARRVKPADR